MIIRHLRDDDDLRFARDGPLLPGQEGPSVEIAEHVIRRTSDASKAPLLFLCSSKRRAVETAAIVANELNARVPWVRILRRSVRDLREMDQGTFVLPEGYSKGEVFPGLVHAWRIFWLETFDERDERQDNLLYKFGDPVLRQDGTHKYPELCGYFSTYGECYRDVFNRILARLLEFAEWRERHATKYIAVVFAHAQTSHLFRDLAEVANVFLGRERELDPGNLAHACWRRYLARKALGDSLVTFTEVDTEALGRPAIRDLLSREIRHLGTL